MSSGSGGNPYESPQSRYGGQPDAEIAARVSGPATGLMVTAGIGIVIQVLGIAANLAGVGMGMAGGQDEAVPAMFSGAMGVVSGVVGIVVGVIVFLGAQKMKALESYGFALTAAILAMVPCVSPCCLIGLPIGIWALVVLNDANVKAAFH
jgi:hypothetical protein